MWPKIICIQLWCLLFAASIQAQASAPEAAAILAATDRIRNPSQPFSTRVTITEYIQARPRHSLVVKVHSKQAVNSGQFRTLLTFVEPLRDRGKLMLRLGNAIWFYDPASKASVRIAPQQRLLGQASNGDVMTSNFSMDYTVALRGEETVADADRRQRPTWHLSLQVRPEAVEASYPTIDYWVDRETSQPVMGRFYASSGHLLKQAYYRGYQEILGEQRPTEVIIIDGVDTSRVTRMRFEDYRLLDIPEEWLQRHYLPNFRGE